MMKWLRSFARWARPSRPSSAERDEALRNEGRRAEALRIEGVYRGASLVELEPLIVRAMFHTRMSPEDAAVMQVTALQAARAAASRPPAGPPAADDGRHARAMLH